MSHLCGSVSFKGDRLVTHLRPTPSPSFLQVCQKSDAKRYSLTWPSHFSSHVTHQQHPSHDSRPKRRLEAGTQLQEASSEGTSHNGVEGVLL
jgi:hypothetical protein